MEVIGLRELNHNLSSVMARVAAGASLVITDRGRPIADLVPHTSSKSPTVRDELIAEGLLRPANKRRRLPSLQPQLTELPDSADMIASDRDKDRER
ncbi:type II toxin-antitoxin system Phd/YefM family antitoxin [Glycomyces xiaoerkulensis]|uniref:type II toxin-antitoxin system Phd/YefM family antitoxin n=1 Tax=Glycomyces xiaoerkulensis TaxID=2038139 RepID=UPI000C26B9A5|nr:type II toxin-antitoxin system prevent-host-death family antitoxin [Glycomyces xiaoerkulensis]